MFGHQDEPKNAATDVTAPTTDNGFGNMGQPISSDSHDGEAHVPAVETPAPSVSLPFASDTTPPSDALLDIKQQALQQLTPLVGHLEQSPEEKFRTTMMMIQASDNQDLIKEAYQAAQAIADEKAKAQALLDIVNEINYFTQHGTK